MFCRFLDPQYRRPLILRELLGFHADIICLQEVDEKAFSDYFLPQLQQAGTFSCKRPTANSAFFPCRCQACIILTSMLYQQMSAIRNPATSRCNAPLGTKLGGRLHWQG